MRAYFLLLLLPLVMLTATGAKCEPLEPTASIQIDSGSFLERLGFQLVEATVRLKGKLYRVRVYGIATGPKGYHASGEIYGLNDIDDIVGRYEPTGQGSVFVNEAGVEIVMSRPAQESQPYVYIDYLGSLYARHDQSAQFGPRD
ncbi:MAG: hypothetical protein ACLQAT_04320 [Candidatus Binataceae bacterium]